MAIPLPNYKTAAPKPTKGRMRNTRKQAANQWEQTYSPQLRALLSQGEWAQTQAGQQQQTIDQDWQSSLAELSKAFGQSRNASAEEHNVRGLYNSGIMGDSLRQLGESYQGDVTKLSGNKSRQMEEIAQNLALTQRQLSGQRGDILGGRGGFIEGLVSQMRDKWITDQQTQQQYRNQIKQQQYENMFGQEQSGYQRGRDTLGDQRWQTEFDRKNFESDREYQMALQSLAGSGGGGRGGGGGGGSVPYWGENMSAGQRDKNARVDARYDIYGDAAKFISQAPKSALGRLNTLMGSERAAQLTDQQKRDLKTYAEATQRRINKRNKKK